jgi:hypothetical protein
MFTDSSDPRAFTAIPITSKLDFWRAFKKGMATRKVGGATHSESSRSHFSLIFSVTRIERKKDISTGTWKVYNKVTSYLSVSDLAGSEKTQEVQSILQRQHASPAKLALGLKESKEINSALDGIQVTMDRIRKKINKSAKEQKEPVRECVLIAVLLVVIVITASHPYSRTHTVTHHFLPLLSFLRTNDYTMIALVTTNGGDIYVYRIGTRIECSKTIYSRVYFVRR